MSRFYHPGQKPPELLSRQLNRDKWPFGTGTNGPICSSGHGAKGHLMCIQKGLFKHFSIKCLSRVLAFIITPSKGLILLCLKFDSHVLKSFKLIEVEQQ